MEAIRIHSVADPSERLLHLLFRKHVPPCSPVNRVDICPDEEGLQVASLTIRKGHRFRPHKHISRPREIGITQETWIVMSGLVRVSYYDIDDSLINKFTLYPGDCTITLGGGHTYEALTTSSVYEVKTGPFESVEADKEVIDD